MKTLVELFYENLYHYTHKFVHFLMIYDKLFSRYRNTDVSVLEIGVEFGGSLELWKTYFGAKAKIYGVDKRLDKSIALQNVDQITLFEGDQSDREFLQSLKEKIPHIDILIDDGSHVSEHQKITFEELFLHIDANGLYICEDMHNCWHPDNMEFNFASYLKDLVDCMLGIPVRSSKEFINKINDAGVIKSVNFYNHLAIIEKFPMRQYLFSPVQTGHENI